MQAFLGIDIGTTSISLVVADLSTAKTLAALTRPHESRMADDEADAYLLDPDKVLSLARSLLDSAIDQYPDIQCIGVTGQMHGIVIVDSDGNAVSPVYTWLDMRAARVGPVGLTYTSELERQTGTVIPPGYGGATLYALSRTGSISRLAVTFCTIADYVVMRLAEKDRPSLDPSLAQSLGFFDGAANAFRTDHWKHVTSLSLPELVDTGTVLGLYKNTIPITAAIGDNQASFLGSVRNPENAILVNIGTSGQICFLETSAPVISDSLLDARPFPTGGRLMVGATLSGGKSFDVLAGLIQDVLSRIGMKLNPYTILDEFVTPPRDADGLRVETTFKGTRMDPEKRGTIRGITLENLRMERLYWAFAEGIIDELYGMIEGHREIMDRPDLYIVACGNAVKKNPSLKVMLEKRFKSPVMQPIHEESAARGAAMTAAAVQDGPSILPDLMKFMVEY